MPLDREDVHSQRPDSGSNSAADITVPDNTDRLTRNGQQIKLLPYARHLVANHTAKSLGDVEDRGESKLSDRRAEDAARDCHRDVACDEFGEERGLQPGRARMDPSRRV